MRTEQDAHILDDVGLGVDLTMGVRTFYASTSTLTPTFTCFIFRSMESYQTKLK